MRDDIEHTESAQSEDFSDATDQEESEPYEEVDYHRPLPRPRDSSSAEEESPRPILEKHNTWSLGKTD